MFRDVEKGAIIARKLKKMDTRLLIEEVENRRKNFNLEDLKKEAHFYAKETGFEYVVLNNGSVWADHWVEKNPQVADRIIYSTLD